MTRVCVHLLGSPQLERDSQAVKLESRQDLALLAHLVVNRGTQRRDALVNLLWPEADLWADLHRFHEVLEQCDGDGHAPSEVCSSCLQPLTGATALYRGDFLEGFGLKNSVNFDDWQRAQTESLRSEVNGAFHRLILGTRDEMDWERAIRTAHR